MALEGKGGRPPGYAKTGGRQRGTPNKATVDVAEKLAALGCDPLEVLSSLAMDRKNPPELRRKCANDLMPYMYSKRKPIDVASEQPTVVNVITNLDSSPDSDGANQPTPNP